MLHLVSVETFKSDVPSYGQTVKVAEEFGEYMAAATAYMKGLGTRVEMADEWADLVQALFNDAAEKGISIEDALKRCNARNVKRGRIGGIL